MKYRLSKHALEVTLARGIKEKWIKETTNNPSLKIVKAPNEVNLFLTI